jgi:hypothetical protein
LAALEYGWQIALLISSTARARRTFFWFDVAKMPDRSATHLQG